MLQYVYFCFLGYYSVCQFVLMSCYEIIEQSSDSLLCQKFSCQKLLKSVNRTSSYSRICRRHF